MPQNDSISAPVSEASKQVSPLLKMPDATERWQQLSNALAMRLIVQQPRMKSWILDQIKIPLTFLLSTCVTETLIVSRNGFNHVSGELVRGGAAIFAALIIASTTSYLDFYLLESPVGAKTREKLEELKDELVIPSRLVYFVYFGILLLAVLNEDKVHDNKVSTDTMYYSMLLAGLSFIGAIYLAAKCLRCLYQAKTSIYLDYLENVE